MSQIRSRTTSQEDFGSKIRSRTTSQEEIRLKASNGDSTALINENKDVNIEKTRVDELPQLDNTSSGNSNISGVFFASKNQKVELPTIHYNAKEIIASGSFGTVILASCGESEELVAIKKTLKVRKNKSREIQILKLLQTAPHPYIISLINHFTTTGSKSSEICTNLVFSYMPESIDSLIKKYNRNREVFPLFLLQVYMYQLARAVAHCHGLNICHRDVKPQNLLVDPEKMVLKLGDFGSAKQLNPGQPNQAYICSRYYRAPELVFGSTAYSINVDIWSMGCVFVEMLTGHPLFTGSSGVDHLYEIIKVLGSPSQEDMDDMKLKEGQEFKLHHTHPLPFKSLFRKGTPDSGIEAAAQMLQYSPSRRPKAIDFVASKFFDNLRDVEIAKSCKFLNGQSLPIDMFLLTNEEISLNYDVVDSILTPDLLVLYHNKTPPPEEEVDDVAEVAMEEPEAEPLPDVDYNEFNFGDEEAGGTGDGDDGDS